MPLPPQLDSIIQEELERAFQAAGKRIFALYLESLTQAQVLAALDSEQKIVEAVEQSIAAVSHPSTLRTISTESRAVFEYLERTLRNKPDGIPLPLAVKLLTRHFSRRFQTRSLENLISRNRRFHTLTIRRRSICLRADLLVDYLAAQFRQQKSDKEARKEASKEAGKKSREVQS